MLQSRSPLDCCSVQLLQQVREGIDPRRHVASLPAVALQALTTVSSCAPASDSQASVDVDGVVLVPMHAKLDPVRNGQGDVSSRVLWYTATSFRVMRLCDNVRTPRKM
jgi:hypothetical protein